MSGPQLPPIDRSATLRHCRADLRRALMEAHTAATHEIWAGRGGPVQLHCAAVILRRMARWASSRL